MNSCGRSHQQVRALLTKALASAFHKELDFELVLDDRSDPGGRDGRGGRRRRGGLAGFLGEFLLFHPRELGGQRGGGERRRRRRQSGPIFGSLLAPGSLKGGGAGLETGEGLLERRRRRN